jgi:hypothetical protein
MSRHHQRAILFLLGVLCAVPCGCSFSRDGAGLFGQRSQVAGGQSRELPAIPTSRDAIQLEIMLIERPVGDTLLGDSFWNEVDQVGSLEPETRLALSRNGFRIGHTGSEPPRALERMLELKSEFASGPNGSPQKNLVGRRIVLASGGETEVQAGSLFSNCMVDIAGVDGVESKEFHDARFVFRVKAERDQDGWARIEFLPEIHHGAYRLRRVPGGVGFQLRTSQDVYPLYSERFSLMLNVGEMAILTTDGENSSSVGGHFFLGDGANARVQRVLIVRLAGMTKTDPVYSK